MSRPELSTPQLHRKITLAQATSINMIDMVGIGPFVVMPFVVSSFGDGLFLWAWVFGAVAALTDGMIWSELGARYPLAGGTYNFHRIAFGEKGGKVMTFLYVWQTSLYAPLVIASGAIGFTHYLTYLVDLNSLQEKLVSGGLVMVVFLLLYRRIETIGKISMVLGTVVILTILWIIVSGFLNREHGIDVIPSGDKSFLSAAFWAAVGPGSIKTVYSYLGYYNVCHLGSEIKDPGRNIPRSIFISIIGISILYLLMNISVMGVMEIARVRPDDKYLVSSFMEHIYGKTAGTVVTVLILFVAMSSLFAVVLGYSRVPYAAAVDRNFFPIFAKLHPTKNFPYVSLIVLCGVGLIFSMFMRLDKVISAILAMRIIIQFIGQAVGVVLLRRRFGTGQLPFRMWLYPIPVILSIIIWIFLFISTGVFAIYGLTISAIGAAIYYIFYGKTITGRRQ